MMKIKISALFLVLLPVIASAKVVPQDCVAWPMNITEGWLKRSGIIDISDLDEPKTEVKLLASQRKAHNLHTNIYRFVFHAKDGRKFEVITQNDASDEECSMSEVNSYLVSKSTINY